MDPGSKYLVYQHLNRRNASDTYAVLGKMLYKSSQCTNIKNDRTENNIKYGLGNYKDCSSIQLSTLYTHKNGNAEEL